MFTVFKHEDKEYRVSFKYTKFEGELLDTSPHKAITECYISLRSNKEIQSAGYSFCSLKDNYVKETGRKIALQRALQGMGLNKEERRKIWEETYFEKEVK